MSVKLRFAVIFSAFILINGLFGAYYFSQNLAADALVINVAGRQRMLSQKLAKDALYLGMNSGSVEEWKSLLALAGTYSSNIDDLIHGNKERGIPATKNEKILVTLSTAQTLAGEFQRKLQQMGQESGVSPKLIDEVNQYGDELLRTFEQVVGLFEAKAQARSSSVEFAQIVVILLNVILAIAAWMFVTYRVSAPLQKLVLGANRIADGDLHGTFSYDSRDEIGQLSKAFNGMQSSLRTLVTRVLKGAQAVSSQGDQFVRASQESGASAEHVASQATEFAASAQQMSGNNDEMVREAQGVSEAAREGERVLEESFTQSTEVKDSIQNTAELVKNLRTSSEEIGSIVGLITGVSEQTNLLALNAAIEAARAGEHGRGFAVVADEVRTLADQSRQAAQKIAGLIRTIQTEIAASVQAIDVTVVKVEENTESMRTSRELFRGISASVRDMTERIQEVAAAVEQISGGSQSVAASAEEQSALVQQIVASAHELSEVASGLLDSVSVFKVSEV